MFLTSEKIKVNISDVVHKPQLTKNNLICGQYQLGNVAFGQINDDAEKDLYTAFVSNDVIIQAFITVYVLDDDFYMENLFQETLQKFNQLNSHLNFCNVTVKPTQKPTIKHIVITYTWSKKQFGMPKAWGG